MSLQSHFPSWGQAVYRSWWPSQIKDMQTEHNYAALCVGVARQIQNIMFHTKEEATVQLPVLHADYGAIIKGVLHSGVD